MTTDLKEQNIAVRLANRLEPTTTFEEKPFHVLIERSRSLVVLLLHSILSDQIVQMAYL